MRGPLIGVRRDRGSRYLLFMIVSFAVTVAAVRLYLDAAGYPKVGGGGLHVAHMLWGGLLLVVAALVTQLYVGRRALALSAIAAGVGVGLFIDEVGKFLTESNDYFFAPAAPIIYGAVLLLLLLWARARRDDRPSAAEATQGAVEALRDLADGRLTGADRDRAVARLRVNGAVPGDDLPGELLALLGSPAATARFARPGWAERVDLSGTIRRPLPDRLERLVIRVGLFLSALTAVMGMLLAIVVLSGDVASVPEVATGPIEYPSEPVWVLLVGIVWALVGVANGVALVLSLAGRHPAGMAIAQYAVLTGLVAGGLLTTFVSQLGALSGVLVQLGLLLLILDQRGRLAQMAAVRG